MPIVAESNFSPQTAKTVGFGGGIKGAVLDVALTVAEKVITNYLNKQISGISQSQTNQRKTGRKARRYPSRKRRKWYGSNYKVNRNRKFRRSSYRGGARTSGFRFYG